MPAVQFEEADWAFFNAHEREDMEDGKVPLHRFRALVKEDVVALRDDLAVVLLHEREGWKVRVATFTPEGLPIQSFLLYDRYGYLYEKNFRAYSMNQPIHFNASENTFDFYQLMYGYEPIPTLDQPSQDPVEHQSFHQVAVNEEGLIELRYSEATGKTDVPPFHVAPGSSRGGVPRVEPVHHQPCKRTRKRIVDRSALDPW